MDLEVALIEVCYFLEDNRDELRCYFTDYISLRNSLLLRKNDDNLELIIESLDERYRELFEELENEYLIYENIINYIVKYIGVSDVTASILLEYAKRVNECAENRTLYEIHLYEWYEKIAFSLIKTTKNYDFPKYNIEINREDLIKLMIIERC